MLSAEMDLELRQHSAAASGQQTRFTCRLSVTLNDLELRRVVESWAEDLRQHERITVEDRAIEEATRVLLKDGGRPIVSHLRWGSRS